MTDSARDADRAGEWFRTRLRLNGPLSSRLGLSTVSVFVLATGLAGCARDSARREVNPGQQEVRLGQQEVRTRPVRTASRLTSHPRPHPEVGQNVELRVRRPSPALLAPQPAPNCEFKRPNIDAVDPDEWTRLKTEYERQCYQDAEKTARDRLGQLQASGVCETERVPATTSRSTTSAHTRPKS